MRNRSPNKALGTREESLSDRGGTTILVKNLETLVAVSPSPMLIDAWLNIGEGEGTSQLGKQCEVEISGFFQKIREKRCLFQRFVTSIAAIVDILL